MTKVSEYCKRIELKVTVQENGIIRDHQGKLIAKLTEATEFDALAPKMDTRIIDYVTEEVWRQGHDITKPEGLQRVSWMLEAWHHAMEWKGRINAGKIIKTGRDVERQINTFGTRTQAVYVGNHEKVAPVMVNPMLEKLVRDQDTMHPFAFYREFEEIHPFMDGNGRVGKILLNYLNKTLDAPVFPADDFWHGIPIQNP